MLDLLAAIEQKLCGWIYTIGEFFWEFADWEWGGRVFNKQNKNNKRSCND